MREILFKAKRVDNGEWVEGYLVKCRKNTYPAGYEIIEADGINYDELDGYYPSYCSERVDESTICQYTGLTDKNGRKIWENDILIYDNSPYNVYCTPHKGEIVCRHGCLCFKYWLYGSTNYMPFFADVFFDKISEVIGNIFDNPELLEAGE